MKVYVVERELSTKEYPYVIQNVIGVFKSEDLALSFIEVDRNTQEPWTTQYQYSEQDLEL